MRTTAIISKLLKKRGRESTSSPVTVTKRLKQNKDGKEIKTSAKGISCSSNW
jgi:hypothetical protein